MSKNRKIQTSVTSWSFQNTKQKDPYKTSIKETDIHMRGRRIHSSTHTHTHTHNPSIMSHTRQA